MESNPRLSTRLLLNLYGEEVEDLHKLRLTRNAMIQRIEKTNDGHASFQLSQFVKESLPATQTASIKDSYKSFLEEVNSIADSSVQQNAAKTMYNIVTKRESLDAAYKDVVSYFGSLPMRQWNRIVQLAQELHKAAQAKGEKEHLQEEEFGSEYVYHPPKIDLSAYTRAARAMLEKKNKNNENNSDMEPSLGMETVREGVKGREEADHGVGNITRLDSEHGYTNRTTSKVAHQTTMQPSSREPTTMNSNVKWLVDQCTHHVNSAQLILSGFQLSEEVLKTYLQSKGNDDVLQTKLFDLVGEAGIEFMFAIMQESSRLKGMTPVDIVNYERDPLGTHSLASTSSSAPFSYDEIHAQNKTTTATAMVSRDGGMFGVSNPMRDNINNNPATAAVLEPMSAEEYEGLSANQKKKRDQKELKHALKQSEQEAVAAGAASAGGGDTAVDLLQQIGFSPEYLLQERALGLQGGVGFSEKKDENWMENLAAEGTLQYHEKRGLPAGTERKIGPGFEEVSIPAAKAPDAEATKHELVPIEALEPWAQRAFGGTKSLNRIQSKVFPCAYNSNENMLVCAPTGAGKTNIAMLSLLQLVKQHQYLGVPDKAAIKAIYIAPMKALAQEVVSKFSERLAPLGLVVKEYTGDMQLTKQEVMDSQLLVCTPEKYDVVTRKGGDGSLGTLVSLIIIDEVHLLADERGAVIETIVARTQRYVESSQRIVRIVGLSATLPNYKDVGTFLRVNPQTGLFFFGPEYRPIPLAQTFIGVTEKQRVKRNEQMNRHAYDKMIEALTREKQVMIFVHSRKETSMTAEAVTDLAAKMGTWDLLDNVQHEKYTLWKRQVDKSRSVEVQQLFAKGCGVHHAGMLRADRSLTEQLFECGLIKVLCCTATLAWGVNLPAHTVIIKGTELYDPERGGFVDLSILDVLQIFGRAGRPQYDTTGHAIMITPHKTLNTYLGLLTQQAPIESGLIKALPDHMNAEIVNGTINNIKEAASWLSYTFLFVRMTKNPVGYGLRYEELFSDPQLEKKRLELVKEAADKLDACMMARFDPRSGNLGVTDLGRIASHYYISHGTIEAFNSMLGPHLGDPDALHVLCSSSEFEQLKVRPEELVEIETLKKDSFIEVRSGVDETAGKVSVLLQGYLNRSRVNSFTLQSDTNYVAKNASRITRALFEICLKRGWSSLAGQYLSLCKAIDRCVRQDQTPLRQFDELPKDVIRRLEEVDVSPFKLLDMDAREVGQLIHNQKLGGKVLSLARALPLLCVETTIQPITRGILKISLSVSRAFDWVDRYHGFAEPFWIWIEDGENEYIYHSEYFILHKSQRKDEQKLLEFTIPVREPLPPQYYVKVVSDAWVGCDSTIAVSFKDLILPTMAPSHTDLLDMHPIPKSALQNEIFESLYKFSHFNPIQSQTFHTLYHTDHNCLVGAPTGSGKTITGELAILRLLRTRPGAKSIYVAPLKALARERLNDWQQKLGRSSLGLNIVELTGDITPDLALLKAADILIVTPEKWDSISRGWQKKQREYVRRVELVIIDEIHLLGEDRGPVLEVIVSRMRFISTQTTNPIRFVGLSTALANPRDLADWLGIGDVGVFNFRPSVRPVPMSIHIQGFPGKHYCPRMATMNKPAYAAILEHSPKKPVLIFVSSRRQTRLTALDIISYCAADDDPKQFLHMENEDELDNLLVTLRDGALRDTLPFGIGIHHAGLNNSDRATVERLFLEEKIQVLVCTATLAWGVNLPCHLVIVKGTEYFDAKISGYVDSPVTDILQMMGRAGRPQFDDTGVACIFVHEPKKNFYKKFLHEPFPVESSLHLQMHEHLNAEICSGGAISSLQDCVEYLTWTYYFRRLIMNPSYYQLEDVSAEGVEKHLSILVRGIARDLQTAGCIDIVEDRGKGGEGEAGEAGGNRMGGGGKSHGVREMDGVISNASYAPTYLGKIASYYYLHYRTVGVIRDEFLEIQAALADGVYQQDILNRQQQHHQQQQQQQEVGNSKLVEDLLNLLCSVYEFSELPVRHNEDLLNSELARDLNCDLHPSRALDSPHTKAYLLLRAHFQHVKLPISDYTNDTKSVLDQAPRVLNAMIDIAAEEGMLEIVLKLTKISQMIIQGLMEGASDLRQLPFMSAEAEQLMARYNIHSIASLRAASSATFDSIIKELFFTGNFVPSSSKEGGHLVDEAATAAAGTGVGERGGGTGRGRGKEVGRVDGVSSYKEFLRALNEFPGSWNIAARLRIQDGDPDINTFEENNNTNAAGEEKVVGEPWMDVPTAAFLRLNISSHEDTTNKMRNNNNNNNNNNNSNINNNSSENVAGALNVPVDADCVLEVTLFRGCGGGGGISGSNSHSPMNVTSSTAAASGSKTHHHNNSHNNSHNNNNNNNNNQRGGGGKYARNVYAPRYHKPKKAGWWIVLGTVSNLPPAAREQEEKEVVVEEVVALKRVGEISGDSSTTTLMFPAPDEAGHHRLRVFLLCDALMGVDASLDISLNVY